MTLRKETVSSGSPFLTAEWRYLAMLNYSVDPAVLLPRVPAGTELDDWDGRTLVSVVGFMFLNTRVHGMAIPFHRNFEEVNLRFYVRRKSREGWRRAVVFVKEIVPRWAIAASARALYGENYVAMRMGHRVDHHEGSPEAVSRVSYTWVFRGRQCGLEVAVDGESNPIEEGSPEAFITEHYWGCAGGPGRPTFEYRVDHPRWRTWSTRKASLNCDVASLYGPEFVPFLNHAPASAFLADGSAVTVFSGVRLRGEEA